MADIAIAVDDEDAGILSQWGARRVVKVPNVGGAVVPAPPSSAVGPVVYLANATYPPNRHGGRWLLEDVWPHVHADLPGARLVVAGQGTNDAFGHHDGSRGVSVVDWVDSVADLMRSASLVVAPVRHGAGTQLKVAEALAYGRVVVATAFSARSVPPPLRGACVVADGAAELARAVVRTYRDVDARHRMEDELRTVATPHSSWESACVGLVSALAPLVGD